MPEERDAIRIPEIARRLGISQQAVKRHLQSGKLRGFKLGRVWLMRTETFHATLKAPEEARLTEDELEAQRRRERGMRDWRPKDGASHDHESD
jgi:excisionase family DNA binding protein